MDLVVKSSDTSSQSAVVTLERERDDGANQAVLPCKICTTKRSRFWISQCGDCSTVQGKVQLKHATLVWRRKQVFAKMLEYSVPIAIWEEMLI